MSELNFYYAIYIKECAICKTPYISNQPPGKGKLICDSFSCYLENLHHPVVIKKYEPKPAKKPDPNSRTIPGALRTFIFARDNGRCRYCGQGATCIDHVRPWIHGGSSTNEKNLVACCQHCNSVLHARRFKSFNKKRTWIRAHLRKNGYILYSAD